VACARATRPSVEIEIVADRDTGLVRRARTTIGGRLVGTVHQLGAIHADSAVLPEAVLQCGYRDGRVLSINVYSPKSVRLGEPLTEKDFAVQLPAGGLALDYRQRGPEGRASVLRTTEATSDVLAKLDQRTYPVTRRTTSLWLVALFVVLPVVLGCGWLALRRR
jgi:hypothetical protein